MVHPGNRRREALRVLAAGCLTAAGLLVFSSTAPAKELAISQLPAAVRDAANRVLSGVKWTSAHQGADYFELKGTDAKGQEVSLEATPDGLVTHVGRKIPLKDVPAHVLKAATNKYPKFVAQEPYQAYDGNDIRDLDKTLHAYELDGTIGNGRKAAVTIDANGIIIVVETEIDLKAVPQVVTKALAKAEPTLKPVSVRQVEQEDTVVGYHFAGPIRKGLPEWTVFVSADGSEIEVDRDE